MKFLSSMLKGIDGETSSKRTVTWIAFLLCALAFICNVFMEIHLEENIFNGMLYLVMAGMGFSAFEKFSPASTISASNGHEATDE